jgi:catechol 2,3-dioxygenase-like lactoylglutathione lyase family enzyme
MTLPEKRGVDHVVLCVRDLDAAVARYNALGFTTTPRAEHPWGTANALVQLDGNFIELLAIAEPEKVQAASFGGFSFGGFCQRFTDRHEGMAMLVFEGADARAEQAEFAAAGLDTYPPFDFSRSAKLPDGGEAIVGFSLAFVTHPAMKEAAFFTCQQHAPEHFWKPDYQKHANGAQQIRRVVMVADAPASYADLFSGLQSPGAVTIADQALTVSTNRGVVEVLTPTAFSAAWPGADCPDASHGPRFALIEIKAGVATPEISNDFGLALALTPA